MIRSSFNNNASTVLLMVIMIVIQFAQNLNLREHQKVKFWKCFWIGSEWANERRNKEQANEAWSSQQNRLFSARFMRGPDSIVENLRILNHDQLGSTKTQCFLWIYLERQTIQVVLDVVVVAVVIMEDFAEEWSVLKVTHVLILIDYQNRLSNNASSPSPSSFFNSSSESRVINEYIILQQKFILLVPTAGITHKSPAQFTFLRSLIFARCFVSLLPERMILHIRQTNRQKDRQKASEKFNDNKRKQWVASLWAASQTYLVAFSASCCCCWQ